ncbi:MAG: 50S ribosomal protein L24 [Cardiobacteriaceae bacterium]|nr:50S ribosomal protein L24 [Cardiobacteriaceae bacterium]
MKRIKKGDEVIVIAGKADNKGKRGKVLAVHGDRVLVEGLNMVVKHVKPNPQLGIEGGIVRKEATIHISNVMLFNPATGKGDRVGFKFEDGKKVRYFKSNGALV